MAILDADKEGFLRSERALIQTIGRAARNVNGRAILYADRITNSMQRAIDETERRRSKQIAFNIEHGITPQGIRKNIADILDTGYARIPGARPGSNQGSRANAHHVAEEYGAYLSPEIAAKKIKKLEQDMYSKARNLEFEEAARLRDELTKIRELAFGLQTTLNA